MMFLTMDTLELMEVIKKKKNNKIAYIIFLFKNFKYHIYN